MTKRPSRKFDPGWQSLQSKIQQKKSILRQRKTSKTEAKKPKSTTSVSDSGGVLGLALLKDIQQDMQQQMSQSEVLMQRVFSNPKPWGSMPLQNQLNQFGGNSPMSSPKFNLGDRVVVVDPANKHKGDSGEVSYFDGYNRSYAVLLEKLGDSRIYRASQLEFEEKVAARPEVIKLAEITEPFVVKAGMRVRWIGNKQNEWYGVVLEATIDFEIANNNSHMYDLAVKAPNANGHFPTGYAENYQFTGACFNAQEFEVLIPSNKKKVQVEFETVIVADEKKDQILEALEQVNQADLIFDVWGFADTIEKGKGVSLLFYGPPGTGKTLMAQAIANKLDRKLVIIGTADVESSAPGEAERNIRKHFKDAKDKDAVLLFDECDSLIYSRQHVGPILGAQINELLSQLERFEGVTIFTTNRLGTLDEAVNRRLALKLEFDMPDRDQRAKIWERMIPTKAPVGEDVNYHKLASVEIAGGYIKNAVLRAARMAATEKLEDAEKQIQMKHFVKALKLEAESMLSFEDARAEHQHGIGAVGTSESGQRVIRQMEVTNG